MNVIFALGDSQTYGAWDRESQGWTSLLRAYLDSIDPFPSYYLYSLGIPGETSIALNKRYLGEIEYRKREDDESYIYILACGANDAIWLSKEERFKATTEQYQENMTEVITSLKKRSGKVLAMNITPVNEKYSRHFQGPDKSCLNEYVDKYNEVLERVCSSTEVDLVDINAVFKEHDLDEILTTDGLHPNSAGHRLIFETIKPKVSP